MAMYLSWTYDEDNESRLLLYIGKVFNTSTLEKRLDSAHRGLLNYTPKLFGQIVIEVNGLKAVETGEQFFWLDVFYVRLLFGVSLAPPLALLALAPALLYVLSFLRTTVNGFGISKVNAFWLVTGILVMENLREISIARISEAETVIKAISDASSGETYVDNVPDVCDKEYTGINKPFFYGDELSFFENVSLITDIDHDYEAYFNRGFVYAPISSYDALYTNDSQVIAAMEKRGYAFQGVCSYERHVNLPYEIVRNKLEESSYGGALLDGPDHSLTQGPYSETKPGTYTVTYELYIDPLDYEEDYKVYTLTALGNYGEKILNKKEVNRSEFDENGHLSAMMNFSGSGTGTEFHAVMEDGQKMEVRDIVFAKSGASDKRIVTDARGNVIHEEYLDAEGKPQMQSGGYYGIDNEYDEQDRLVHRTYLGEDWQPVMIGDGYAQYFIEYMGKNSTRTYTYFDIDSNPVKIKNGYHKDYVECDDKRRNVREIYFDLDGDPVLVNGSYAGVLREYDEANNVVSLIYLGTDLKPTMLASGYAQIKRAFNDKKQIVREE